MAQGRRWKVQGYVRCQCNEFGCIFPRRIDVAIAPTIVDADILPDGPAQLRQGVNERVHAVLRFRIIGSPRGKYANAAHSLGLLRVRNERHHRRAANDA